MPLHNIYKLKYNLKYFRRLVRYTFSKLCCRFNRLCYRLMMRVDDKNSEVFRPFETHFLLGETSARLLPFVS